MSRFNRHNLWAGPTRTTNANRHRVFDEDDGTSNMQMVHRAQQPSRPSHSTTSGALTRRSTERDRPAERVESWRDEKHSEDLSGTMSRMRVSERPLAASRPRPRPDSPSPERPSPPRRREREIPRHPASRQRAPSPSPSPPAHRRPSPPPARNRRTPSPDWNQNEPVRTRQPRRPAPRSPPPPAVRMRRARSPSPFSAPLDDNSGVRRRTRNPMEFSSSLPPRNRLRRQPSNKNNNSSSFSYSITTTSYSSGGCTISHTKSTINGQRMRDIYRSTRDPRCPFCGGYHSDEPTIWYS